MNRAIKLFDKLIENSFWLLFFPHNSDIDYTPENYKRITNTYFPDLTSYLESVKSLLKEIPLAVKSERPDLTSLALRAMACLNSLVIERQSSTNIVAVFTLYRQLLGANYRDRQLEHSRLLQVLMAYSSEFTGDVDLYIPTSRSGDNGSWANIGNVSVSYSGDNSPPFYRWFNNLLGTRVKDYNSDQLNTALRTLLEPLAFPFMPVRLSEPAYLPLPNIFKLWTMMNIIIPEESEVCDSAIRLYSAMQFVTFGISSISLIGEGEYVFKGNFVNFSNYYLDRAKQEAERVSKYNITDFNKSQVAGALESFRLSELDFIKREIFPDDEDDSELDADAHNPDTDKNLDPDPDRIQEYSFGDISKEDASDLDSDSDDDPSGDDSKDSDDGKQDDSKLDESSNLGDSLSAPTDPSSNPTDPNDPNSTEVKEVSSKNAISKKAYTKMWGDSPFELANDNDPEGYFYRNNVLMLNKHLQEDPGDAVPRSVKGALDKWCKFWIHCADVRFTVKLLDSLKLTRFLKV